MGLITNTFFYYKLALNLIMVIKNFLQRIMYIQILKTPEIFFIFSKDKS